MAVVESFKIMASMWLFVRAFAKGVIYYISEHKAPRQNQLKGEGLKKGVSLPEKLPTAVDIKRVIPKHCFQPTVAQSMLHAFKDIVQIVVCYFLFATLHTAIPNSTVYWASMVFYWAVQGTFFTAVFVVGHDCGHGSFSSHTWLNDLVGNVFHSFLLVPYYMWKLSHRHHHKHNANFDKDEVFYPVRKSDPTSQNPVLPGFGFGIGWFAYLAQGYRPRTVNHYNPWHQMFVGHVARCLLSLMFLGGMYSLVYWYYSYHGFLALFSYYLVPVFIFASYTVVITFLHHTEMNIPWYADHKWDFVRGQLSTIDRNYGIVHYVIHSIGTHQMHHMFTRIPHYHLEEATVHFRKAFPQLVRTCEEPILPSFLRMFRKYMRQMAMDEDTEVHLYK